MSGLGLKLALRLHPAAYRHERGEELAAVFEDSTAGATRWATARETFDLAGHGVRQRIGLGADRLPARLAALAAPFAATAAAPLVQGGILDNLVDQARFDGIDSMGRALWPTYPSSAPFPGYPGPGYLLTLHWLGMAGLLFYLVSACAAAFGRWSTARLIGPLGLAASLSAGAMEMALSPSWDYGAWSVLVTRAAVLYGPQTLWVLIMLAAPRDLLGPATQWRTRSALAGVLGALVFTEALGIGVLAHWTYGPFSEALALILDAAELTLVAVAVPALLRGRYGPAAAALAGAPVLCVLLLTAFNYLWKNAGHGTALALLGVVAALAVVLSRRRPMLPDRRPPKAG